SLDQRWLLLVGWHDDCSMCHVLDRTWRCRWKAYIGRPSCWTVAAQLMDATEIDFRLRRRSAPLERHRDVAWHPAGEIDDFDPKLVSAGPEVLRPELIDLFRHSGRRVFPARLLLIDGAPLVRAQCVRKPVHLYLCLAIGYRALDDLDGALNALFIGDSRWLRQVIEQSLFLRLGRRVFGGFLGCCLSLREREFLHEIACAGQQLVGFGRHVPSSSTPRGKTSACGDHNFSPVGVEYYIIGRPSGEGST